MTENGKFQKYCTPITSITLVVIAIAIFVTVYYSQQRIPSTSPKIISTKSSIEKLSYEIRELIDTEQIRKNLRAMTVKTHIAGTENNLEVAEFIKKQLEQQGLERVHFNEYNVLLNYPDWKIPNIATILNRDGQVTFQTAGKSESSPEWMPNDPATRNHWLAFSGNGSVEAEIVYVNKATKADFEHLKMLNIDPRGKVFLVRHSGAFRGSIVKNCKKQGAVAVILYNDPEQVAKDGTDEDHVYPKTDKMPPDAVQRGTLTTVFGDALTPAFPAIKNWHKQTTVEEVIADGSLPNIPCLPISYSDAEEIFKKMKGDEVIDSFRGKLDVIYRYGPGFAVDDKIRVTVTSNYEEKIIQNVIGYLRGSEEPDRYLIISNHYDAWTNGAVDPNSGSSALLEVSRILMEYHRRTGWRPARTILFAHWDAEEMGFIGSAEFAEEYREQLMKRAIGVINTDFIGSNSSIMAMSNPSVTNVLREATKRVPHTADGEFPSDNTKTKKGQKTWFDTLDSYTVKDSNNRTSNKLLMLPAGGSDQLAFFDYLGVPTIFFVTNSLDAPPAYPLYHTHVETPFLVENIIDNDGLKIHRSVVQLVLDMALQFTESPIIPYDFSELMDRVVYEFLPEIRSRILNVSSSSSTAKEEYLKIGLEQLELLEKTAAELLDTTNLRKKREPKEEMSSYERARENDRNIEFEKCFIVPSGVSDVQGRHLLFHPNPDNIYAGCAIQQVHSVIESIEGTNDDEQKLEALSRQLAHSIAQVHYGFLCGKHSLSDFFSI